jgi:hypothetical protein
LSKYRIYRANFSDPGKTGRKNKWLFSIYVLLFILLLQIPNYCNSLGHKEFSWFGYFSFSCLVIFIIVLIFKKLKSMSNSLERIGILELTRTSIKKEIGDLKSTYKYDEILKMELEIYIRDVTISLNKPGSLTHLLKIIHKDSTVDALIISDKSLDFKQKIGIVDSLKTLKTIAGLDILIKNN